MLWSSLVSCCFWLTVYKSSLAPHAGFVFFSSYAGWPQSKRTNYLSFSGFSRATNLLFHRLLQQEVNVMMTFIKGHDDPVYPVNSCFTQIFEQRTKILCLLQWGCTEFTEFPENSLSFPCSEKSLSIPGFPGFPGLWPPCYVITSISRRV